eukprot:CAMPEP_0174822268 /NCGR_PEP_ID=MMETSP1107-20130205/14699_1 /TAXON_ID=36770 /ORGANISM="Paraphysomonas vestita, Strain GFlagA" /LENGTH=66 /DNA_ID=CAMNT_0016040755 /DNA_START=1 /DNA_END=201 /DNA_ORIENTATION=-
MVVVVVVVVVVVIELMVVVIVIVVEMGGLLYDVQYLVHDQRKQDMYLDEYQQYVMNDMEVGRSIVL